MTMILHTKSSLTLSLLGVCLIGACGKGTTFSSVSQKPSTVEPAVKPSDQSHSKQGVAKVEPEIGPGVIVPEVSPAPLAEAGVVAAFEVSPSPSPVSAPSAVPAIVTTAAPLSAPSTAQCKADLTARFRGYTLKGGTSVAISPTFVAYPDKKAVLSFGASAKLSYVGDNLTARSGLSAESEGTFEVSLPGISQCVVTLTARLMPDDAFVSASAQERGLKATLYRLAKFTPHLPDFSHMTASGEVYLSSVDVAERSYATGFPGVDAGLTEWFGLDFRGLLLIETPGNYQFKLVSDDGSKLFLNGQEVIDNDGQHGPTAKESQVVALERGAIPLRLPYFQGPAHIIALQLFYKGPGMTDWTLVPQSMLRVGN